MLLLIAATIAAYAITPCFIAAPTPIRHYFDAFTDAAILPMPLFIAATLSLAIADMLMLAAMLMPLFSAAADAADY